MQKDGQRVTDAVLVPIILNTYGAVGEKAIEFLYAVAGAKAKGIVDEISMLAVLLSADMILQSHAPSNLSNLTSLPSPAKQAAEPVEQPAVRGQEEEVEKDRRRREGVVRTALKQTPELPEGEVVVFLCRARASYLCSTRGRGALREEKKRK